MTWNQPFCGVCFSADHPGRTPVRLMEAVAVAEICANCGMPTSEGIYVRRDPKTVNYPRRDDDE